MLSFSVCVRSDPNITSDWMWPLLRAAASLFFCISTSAVAICKYQSTRAWFEWTPWIMHKRLLISPFCKSSTAPNGRHYYLLCTHRTLCRIPIQNSRFNITKSPWPSAATSTSFPREWSLSRASTTTETQRIAHLSEFYDLSGFYVHITCFHSASLQAVWWAKNWS